MLLKRLIVCPIVCVSSFSIMAAMGHGQGVLAKNFKERSPKLARFESTPIQTPNRSAASLVQAGVKRKPEITFDPGTQLVTIKDPL